jgi:hypothetical protein
MRNSDSMVVFEDGIIKPNLAKIHTPSNSKSSDLLSFLARAVSTL